jgi:predicted nucleotidyltransferase
LSYPPDAILVYSSQIINGVKKNDMVNRSLIRKYARTVGREFRPQRVVLFGSYARGKATEDSDVDILIIMDHDKPRNVDQAIAIRLKADTPFPMDLLVKRPAEVAERLAMNDTFIRSILEEGEVLYE